MVESLGKCERWKGFAEVQNAGISGKLNPDSTLPPMGRRRAKSGDAKTAAASPDIGRPPDLFVIDFWEIRYTMNPGIEQDLFCEEGKLQCRSS